jgi:hypothetical protein
MTLILYWTLAWCDYSGMTDEGKTAYAVHAVSVSWFPPPPRRSAAIGTAIAAAAVQGREGVVTAIRRVGVHNPMLGITGIRR